MHTYQILTDQADLDQHILPVLQANGSEIPPPGCYVSMVEFDESGEVYAYQNVQIAAFCEGVWSRGPEAHLLRLFRMALRFIRDTYHLEQAMTMTKRDAVGLRLGAIVEQLGLKNLNLNVYRGKI